MRGRRAGDTGDTGDCLEWHQIVACGYPGHCQWSQETCDATTAIVTLVTLWRHSPTHDASQGAANKVQEYPGLLHIVHLRSGGAKVEPPVYGVVHNKETCCECKSQVQLWFDRSWWLRPAASVLPCTQCSQISLGNQSAVWRPQLVVTSHQSPGNITVNEWERFFPPRQLESEIRLLLEIL